MDVMAFQKMRERGMKVRIDDDMLGRLVSYEVHVKKRFARVAQSRWLDFNVDAERDYEKLKELKSRITSLVDLAFCKYGVEKGLMKAGRDSSASDLDDDLESLAGQLKRTSMKDLCPSKDKNIALVI
jgi:hypothetical protein